MYQANVDCVSFCFSDLFFMTFSTQNKKNRAITLNFQQKSFVHFVEDNCHIHGKSLFTSLRKQRTFRDANTGFNAK